MTAIDNRFDNPPYDPEALAAFVREEFGIAVPDRRICPGHGSPLDYLARSFFGQEDLLIWANRGGGKTYLAAVGTVLDALFHGPLTVLVLGGSFDQSDRLAAYIRDILTARPDLVDGRMTRQRVRLVNGSEVRMLAQSQQAVRGQHVQRIRCDEVDLFDEEVWRAVQFSTRSLAAGGSAGHAVRGSIEVLSTLHRPGGLMQRLVDASRGADAAPPRGAPAPGLAPAGYGLVQWCLWEVIERCPPERSCRDCPLADDCRGLARRGRGFFRIDDAIAIKARSSRAAWEAEMLCLGAERDHLVFGEFSRARHVRSLPYCPDWPLYRAIDFGYRSPLVCLWVQVTPAGAVHVIREYVRSMLPVATHARAIRRRDPGPAAATYVDPAGRQREAASGKACTEILAAEGIPCVWRNSSVADGLELVRSALAPAVGPATLLISPECPTLIDAFERYHYPADRAGGDAAPVKDGPDHAVDALRYFFVNRLRPKRSLCRGRY